MKYLIKTPGRTGSHLIIDYIRSNEAIEFAVFNKKGNAYSPEDYLTMEMFLDHSVSIPKNTKDAILIISKRKNIAHQLLSGWVGILRSTEDSNKNFEKVNHFNSLDLPIALAESFKAQQEHYEHLKTLPWKEVHEFYMEDFLEDPSVLCVINNGKAPNDWKHAEEHGPQNSGLAINYKEFFNMPIDANLHIKNICRDIGIK
jgi:hypothetical protein